MVLEMKIQFSTEVLSFCIFNKIQFSKGRSVGFFFYYIYIARFMSRNSVQIHEGLVCRFHMN